LNYNGESFVKSSLAIPKKEEAIIICPVEETGKNSVIPSIEVARKTQDKDTDNFLVTVQ
jgi:hypothetical protein